MNYENLATNILELVGGKENISFTTYCMTRLRISYKDKGLINDEAINNLKEVIGTKFVGQQYQVIIGPEVESVYKVFCKVGGFETNEGVDLPVKNNHKEKLTFKRIVSNIMEVISASVVPMLPIITAAGLMKMIVALLGPSMFNVMSETSHLMTLLTLVGDAGFYFFPVFVGYASAKKFNCNIPISLFLACILLHPTLVGIVAEGAGFSVYGIPMVLTSYASAFIPMILITWVQSYVEKVLIKYIPKCLKALLFPLLIILIMLPIALCVLGPLGTILGEGIAGLIVFLHKYLGPVSIGLVGALWALLIATGMHQALIAIALSYIATAGVDDSILVGATVCAYVLIAIALAYLLKAKNSDDRIYGSTSLVTLAVGGVSEPTIFGIILKYKKAILYLLAGGFAGGFYAGLMNVVVYFVGAGNFLVGLMFVGENPNNFLHGAIACVIGFAVAFILAMIFGFESNKGKVSHEENIVSE